MKKNILFILVSFIFTNSSALTYDGCDYSTIARMKSIVSNINISYDYKIVNNDAHFSITLNNLTEDIYFKDTNSGNVYYYSNTNKGEIIIHDYSGVSGSYKFYSNNNNCKGMSLGTKYYSFPSYNKYYNDPLCESIPNYSLCQKWVNVNYSRDEFENLVSEYLNTEEGVKEKIMIEYSKSFLDKVIQFYIDYYWIILGSLILIGVIVIFIYNRKNRFNL